MIVYNNGQILIRLIKNDCFFWSTKKIEVRILQLRQIVTSFTICTTSHHNIKSM